jgi:peroxiredoxin Q/BCP
MATLAVGDKAPAFGLKDQHGNLVRLSSFKGQRVVVYFYPKADTPGCTAESQAFRDIKGELTGAGAAIVGVSRDDVAAQKKFAEKYDLQYPLLADADQTICNRFGVIVEKNMYGKKVTGIERTTFVIGPDQKLLHIFSKVKPEGHAEEVLALLKKK